MTAILRDVLEKCIMGYYSIVLWVSFKVNRGNIFGDFRYCPLNGGFNTVAA